ncbi:MAG: HAD-IB family phosphatase [Syntrophorhabdaceae bacterium]|nr:HAD-IB family phosphatase [Syntrophorhabdaceae bacterium]
MEIKVAFLDCDGTLTKIKSSWEYLHRRLNIWDNMADRYQELFRAGKISYHEFCERDAILWKGIPTEKIWGIIRDIDYQDHVREFVDFLKSQNIYTVIVSTGLSMVVERVKEELGIDMAIANELLSEDGLLTGKTRVYVEYDKKDLYVKEIIKKLGFTRHQACAVGDGEGDKGLFESVGIGIRLIEGIDNIEGGGDYIKCGSLLQAKDILKRYILDTRG